MPNRLSHSSSPYLLQHADNPVDWFEWGDEAFEEARRRDVPVLLSVGYATCHWCHVMAHESFEDGATATYLNEHYVAVKVDREERPDIDRIYMDAVQAHTGRGGWPMTLFLTPTGEPFFAGTYYPPEPRQGHPSFRQVLEGVAEAWRTQRSDLVAQAERLTDAVRTALPPAEVGHVADVVDAAVAELTERHDWAHGGFGGAPKFPQPSDHELLLRVLALGLLPDRAGTVRAMLVASLDAMAAGGIHDQLSGGFSRYSVDSRWAVPHFEKMLYDNALLARVYLRSWQVTGVEAHRKVAVSTLDYLLTDLADAAGGFHSGEDADSEGEEGRFYVWGWDEFAAVTAPDTELAAAAFGASRAGNFEGGATVLSRPATVEDLARGFGLDPGEVDRRVETVRTALLDRRNGRERPSVDDKVVAAWNGLALRALAEGAAVLGPERYLGAAHRLAAFLVDEMVDERGRLARTWRRGRRGPEGFCDDYAAVAIGLFALYQVDGDTRWYREAERLVRLAVDLFADPEGGFFATAGDADPLIARPKNHMDHPVPSDNSLMVEALVILGAYTGDPSLRRTVDGAVGAAGSLLLRHPSACAHLVAVMASSPPREVALTGPPEAMDELSAVVWDRFRPDVVVARSDGAAGAPPLLDDRPADPAVGTAYVCRDFVCELPVHTAGDLRDRLGGSPG